MTVGFPSSFPYLEHKLLKYILPSAVTCVLSFFNFSCMLKKYIQSIVIILNYQGHKTANTL
jgi:hypothetical protein